MFVVVRPRAGSAILDVEVKCTKSNLQYPVSLLSCLHFPSGLYHSNVDGSELAVGVWQSFFVHLKTTFDLSAQPVPHIKSQTPNFDKACIKTHDNKFATQ